MFINLWTHSCYSLLSSITKVDDLISYALKNNQKYAAIIDNNNLYGAIEFYLSCKKNNIIPIIGLQINDNGKNVLLFALNKNGFYNITKISSFITVKNQKKWFELIDDVVVIVDDIDNYHYLSKHKHLYSYNQQARKPIAIKEAYCQTAQDLYFLDILYCISNDCLRDDLSEDKKKHDCFTLNSDEMKKTFNDEALNNLKQLLPLFNIEIDLNKQMHFVKYKDNFDSHDLLKNHCKEGLKARLTKYQYPNYPSKYINQLKYELDVINKMNFSDYFLVVNDYVNFAKQNGILVGPGRGSAAGSLVSYLLGITAIDPIEHHLIFERFLNPSRKTMPDIDVDFLDERRNEVVNYLFERYGYDRTAHIVTFQTIKVKSAIKDAGRVLGYNFKTLNQITSYFPNFVEDVNINDIKKMISNDDELAQIASQNKELFNVVLNIIGIPRQIGLHAAGIVVADKPIWEIIPVNYHTDGTLITQFPMEYLEMFGLIKMDILGLSNLAIIDKTIKLVKTTQHKQIDVESIPLNNSAVFAQLSTGDTIGVFQFESDGMANLMTKIKPQSIEDLSIVSSLYRPGPQKNISTYLENRTHPEKIIYLNDIFKDILSPTYNVIVYQEQVIQIARQIGDFTNTEADNFRRAISKKNSEVLLKFKDSFIANGKKKGYTNEQLDEYYQYILNFGDYGFNHSHSIAYAYVSYWIAYLKTNFQLEFLTTLFNNCNGALEKIKFYAQYLKTRNIKLLPPSINNATFEFNIVDKSIMFGLGSIKGIGYNIVNKIIQARASVKNKFDNYSQAIKILSEYGVGEKTIETLIKAGTFDQILNGKSRLWLITNLNALYESLSTKCLDLSLVEVEQTKQQQLQLDQQQHDLIGISFAEHPLTAIKKNYLSTHKCVDLNAANQLNILYYVVAKINSFRSIKTKTGLDMAFLTIEDDTYVANKVALFPNLYNKLKTEITVNDVYEMNIKYTTQGFQLLSLKKISSI